MSWFALNAAPLWLVFLPGLVILSASLTRGMIHLAPQMGLVDTPSDRRIHKTVIPRAGGIAVFITLLTGLYLMPVIGAGDFASFRADWLLWFTISSAIIVGIGVIDDRFGMSAWLKLAAQIAAATLFFFHQGGGTGSLLGIAIPLWVDLAVHIAWTVILINGFNLIDGMDGLCAGLGLIASAILGVLAAVNGSLGEAVVCGIMAASLLGFLRYNFHPARIFLGDAGSMLIGFFIATAGASAAGRQSVATAILLPLLIGGVPLLDVALAVWRRSARRFAHSKPGEAAIKIFGPDRDHLHHRLLDWGLSQRHVAFLIYAMAIGLAGIGLLPIIGGTNWLALSAMGIIMTLLVGLRYLAPLEFITSGHTLRALVRRPWPSRLYVLSYFFYDLIALLAASFFAWWLICKARPMPFDVGDAWKSSAVFAACGIVALRACRAQSRRWSRACIYEFAEMAMWLFCGAAGSYVIQSWTAADISFVAGTRHIVATAAALALLFLPRSIGFFFTDSVIDAMHRKRRLRTKNATRTTVLYGAGDLGELFICHLRLSQPDRWMDDHFVGFIDDNASIVGRWIRGFQILGTSDALPLLTEKHRVNNILITQSHLSPDRLERLRKQCKALGIGLRQWNPSLNDDMLTPDVLIPPPVTSAPSSPPTNRPSIPGGASRAGRGPEPGSRPTPSPSHPARSSD